MKENIIKQKKEIKELEKEISNIIMNNFFTKEELEEINEVVNKDKKGEIKSYIKEISDYSNKILDKYKEFFIKLMNEEILSTIKSNNNLCKLELIMIKKIKKQENFIIDKKIERKEIFEI